MKLAPRIALTAVILFASSAVTHAEAWPRGRGHVYVHIGHASSKANEIYDRAGKRSRFPGRDSEESRVSLYLELGLTDSWTFVVSVPYEEIDTRGLVSTFSTSGFADADIRLRRSWRLPAGFTSLEAGAIIPAGYDEEEFPQLGSGETDWLVSGSFARSLTGIREGFIVFDLGYRWRGGFLSDEIPWSLKIGAFPHPRLGTFLFTRGWQSRATFNVDNPLIGLMAMDSERTTAGVELYLRTTSSFDVNASWSSVIDGRNTLVGDEYSVGIAFRR